MTNYDTLKAAIIKGSRNDVTAIVKAAIDAGEDFSDLHDIGKNLVAIMLKGAGYDVVDLGVNCDVAKFDEGVAKGATVVACSSLLTTTMPYMRDVVEHFKGRGVKVIIGGAPITQAYADEIIAKQGLVQIAVSRAAGEHALARYAALGGRAELQPLDRAWVALQGEVESDF